MRSSQLDWHGYAAGKLGPMQHGLTTILAFECLGLLSHTTAHLWWVKAGAVASCGAMSSGMPALERQVASRRAAEPRQALECSSLSSRHPLLPLLPLLLPPPPLLQSAAAA